MWFWNSCRRKRSACERRKEQELEKPEKGENEGLDSDLTRATLVLEGRWRLDGSEESGEMWKSRVAHAHEPFLGTPWLLLKLRREKSLKRKN